MTLPCYETAMRDAKAYLRRRDLSSQDEIPLYFAWQRLYATANANLSTDFLHETCQEHDARLEARIAPRSGLPPPLFTSFDKDRRVSAHTSAFLRSKSMSNKAIETMARRYRREAENLRSSREKLVSTLDEAEDRFERHQRRQHVPMQELEEDEALEWGLRNSTDYSDRLSWKRSRNNFKESFSSDAKKRAETRTRREKESDGESDDKRSRAFQTSKVRESFGENRLGKKDVENDDTVETKELAKASELRGSSLTMENVAAFTSRVSSWKMPSTIYDTPISPEPSEKEFAMYEPANRKRFNEPTEARESESVLEHNNERDRTVETWNESLDLKEKSHNNRNISKGIATANALKANRSQTKHAKHTEQVLEDKTKYDLRPQVLKTSVQDSDSFTADLSSLPAQELIFESDSDSPMDSDLRYQLSKAVGDMQVKIQGKLIRVSFTGELDDEKESNRSKEGITLRKTKQQVVAPKILAASGKDVRESGGNKEHENITKDKPLRKTNDETEESFKKPSNARFIKEAFSDSGFDYSSEEEEGESHRNISAAARNEHSITLQSSGSFRENVLEQDDCTFLEKEQNVRENETEPDVKYNDKEDKHSDDEEDMNSLKRSKVPAEIVFEEEEDDEEIKDGSSLKSGQRYPLASKKDVKDGDRREAHSEDCFDVKEKFQSRSSTPRIDNSEEKPPEVSEEAGVNVNIKGEELCSVSESDNEITEFHDEQPNVNVSRQTILKAISVLEQVQRESARNGLHSSESSFFSYKLPQKQVSHDGVLEERQLTPSKRESSTPNASSLADEKEIDDDDESLQKKERSNQSQRQKMSEMEVEGGNEDDSRQTNLQERENHNEDVVSRKIDPFSKPPQLEIDDNKEHKCQEEEEEEADRYASKRAAEELKSHLHRLEDRIESALKRGCRCFNTSDEKVIPRDNNDKDPLDERISQKSGKSSSNCENISDANQEREDEELLESDHEHSSISNHLKEDKDNVSEVVEVPVDRKCDKRRAKLSADSHSTTFSDRKSQQSEVSDGSSTDTSEKQSKTSQSLRRRDGANAVDRQHSSKRRELRASERPKSVDLDAQSLSDASEESSQDAPEKLLSSDECLRPKEKYRHGGKTEREVKEAPKRVKQSLMRDEKATSLSRRVHRKREELPPQRHKQQEAVTRSSFDSEDDFSDSFIALDRKRYRHRKSPDTAKAKGSISYLKHETQPRIRDLLNSTCKHDKWSRHSLDFDSESEDKSSSDTDSHMKVGSVDTCIRSHRTKHRQFEETDDHLSRSRNYLAREKSSKQQHVSPLIDYISKSNKLEFQQERYKDEIRSEWRAKDSAKRSSKHSKEIVWPPGMDAKSIARLGRDDHHPLAPPGLEHLVTEDQWNDYWTWLHWYSAWQMWYLNNDKKTKHKILDKMKRSRHTSDGKSRTVDAKRERKHT